MASQNNQFLVEDSELLMDYEFGFQHDGNLEHILDDILEDELEDNDWESDRHSTPVFNECGVKPKSCIRDGLDNGGGKRKRLLGGGGSGKKREKKVGSSKISGRRRKSKVKGSFGDDPAEVKEMWNAVAGGDLEDDKKGTTLVDDDNFIDDSGVDPADHCGSGHGHAPKAEGGEDDDEFNNLFKMGKKKSKSEKNPLETAMMVEKVMAELEVALEEDTKLNMESKPAINKLMKLPLLTEALSKKHLQLEFLDHGVLTLLKTWLEPLPDGSLPNINVRAAILKILTEFPIDLDQSDRRQQLKQSGIGKVIMFLSKSDEETTSNRKLAKDLVEKWSRPLYNKSIRFEDMRNFDDERISIRRPSIKKPMNKTYGMQSLEDDLDLAKYSLKPKSENSLSRQRASRPEARPLDFVVRPQSKIDPDNVRVRAKQVLPSLRQLKVNKRFQQLKTLKRKQLQAMKLSVEGRGMVNYL